MEIDKLFENNSIDNVADNVFGVVNNSVSEVREMQRKKVAENVQLVVNALKKIEEDIREKYDSVSGNLEKRIISIKDGRDGINGRDGKDGKDGKPGKEGRPGRDGKDGKNGLNGADGQDGVSVVNAHIDFDGSLIISLSSGIEINVGEVVAPALAEQIKVITNGGGTAQSVLDTLTSLQSQIDAIGEAVVYKGLWNASTNSPTITSGVGTSGNFYIVSVAGSTNLDGITNWKEGDWAVFNGVAWQRVEGGADGNFTTVTASSLTSGRVTYAGAGGLLQDSSNLTFNGTTLTSAGFSGPLNGTVGATTPSTGAFTTLSATSATTLGSDGSSVAAYMPGGSAFRTNSVGDFYIDTKSSDGGSIVVRPRTGTVATFSTTGLAVTGAGAFTKATAGDVITFTNAAASNKTGYLYSDNTYIGLMNIAGAGAGEGFLIGNSGHIYGQIGGSTKIDVSSTGLAVTGTLSATGAISGTGADNNIVLSQNGSTQWRINNSNAGTAAAANLLLQNGTAVAGVYLFGTGYTTNGVLKANSASLYNNNSAGVSIAADNASGVITFASGGLTERARIDSSGNAGIGTTSAYNSAKLSVNGDLEARGNIKSYYSSAGGISNGATQNIMTLPAGSYGSPLSGMLNIQQRNDNTGNLTMSTYLVSAWGGAGAIFTAVSTINYGSGSSFSITASTSGGDLTIYITNTSGATSTSINFSFMRLAGTAPTYAF